jgi:hypothetical protein
MVMTGVRHLPMRIGGEDVETDDVFEILNPATETKNVHLDLSRRLDRRIYDVLLSEPPLGEGEQ